MQCTVTDRVAWSVGLSHYVKYALQSFLTDLQQLESQLSTWPLSFCAYNGIRRNNSLCVNGRASTVPICAEMNAFVTNYCFKKLHSLKRFVRTTVAIHHTTKTARDQPLHKV